MSWAGVREWHQYFFQDGQDEIEIATGQNLGVQFKGSALFTWAYHKLFLPSLYYNNRLCKLPGQHHGNSFLPIKTKSDDFSGLIRVLSNSLFFYHHRNICNVKSTESRAGWSSYGTSNPSEEAGVLPQYCRNWSPGSYGKERFPSICELTEHLNFQIRDLSLMVTAFLLPLFTLLASTVMQLGKNHSNDCNFISSSEKGT